MKVVRFIANILFYITRISSVLFLLITTYAVVMILLSVYFNASWIPVKITDHHFQIFYPFTKTTFLLGDYTMSYLVTNFFTIGFYGFFLWLLSQVFNAFRQRKIFTQEGVARLSGFYLVNLIAPFLFLILLAIWRDEINDIVRIIFLHLIIAVFAFFMAAIFKQGLLLQEEQDLTF